MQSVCTGHLQPFGSIADGGSIIARFVVETGKLGKIVQIAVGVFPEFDILMRFLAIKFSEFALSQTVLVYHCFHGVEAGVVRSQEVEHFRCIGQRQCPLRLTDGDVVNVVVPVNAVIALIRHCGGGISPTTVQQYGEKHYQVYR